MKTDDYNNSFLKQDRKCAVCGSEMASGDFWAVNMPYGVRLIHGKCFKNMEISGCHAQVEILYKPGR